MLQQYVSTSLNSQITFFFVSKSLTPIFAEISVKNTTEGETDFLSENLTDK